MKGQAALSHKRPLHDIAKNLTEGGHSGENHFFVKGQLLGLLNRDLPSETGHCVACPYFPPVLKRSILEIMITGFKLEVYLIENNQVAFKGISCAPVLPEYFGFVSFLRIIVTKP